MMKAGKRKMSLEDKVRGAYFRKTGRADGWEVWTALYGVEAQESIAREFGVSLRTSAVWHQEYKQGQAA